MTDRRLVINADDFGMAAGVDEGIIDATAARSVSSVSVITNLYESDRLSNAIARLHAASPEIGVGLHFNCLAGHPLTAAPTLIDRNTGEFLGLSSMLSRLVTGSVSVRDVARECDAQFETLAAAVGKVSHVDSHLHVHTLPQFRPAFAALVRRYGVPHLRRPLESMRIDPLSLVATCKKLLVRAVSAVATDDEVSDSDSRVHFAGFSLRGDHNLFARLMRFLDNLPFGVTELMVHPGFVDPAARRYTRYVEGRDIERAVLTSISVRTRLRQGDIVLTHF